MTYNKLMAFALLAFLAGCATGGDTAKPPENAVEGQVLFTSAAEVPDSPIMVLVPRGLGLEKNESWIPVFIQGTLNSRLKKFSPLTVLERQYVDSIFAEMKKSESDFYSDADYAELGKWSTARYILAGSVTKSGGGNYAVDLKITEIETLRVAASFTESAAASELTAGRLLNEAAEALLKGMDVSLTDAGREALYKSSSSGDIALARGIIARQGGLAFDALAAYYEAGFYNPSLKEAIDGLSSLLNEISDVNLGESLRADVQLRNKWGQMINECNAYFLANAPFEIVYDSAPVQSGELNFQSATIDMETTVALVPTAAFKAVQSVEDGLAATGKKKDWGFGEFPYNIKGLQPAFTVELTLTNGEGAVIGRQTCSFSVSVNFNGISNSPKGQLIIPRTEVKTVRFPGIRAGVLKGEIKAALTQITYDRNSPLKREYFSRLKISSLTDYLARLEMPPLDMVSVPGEDFLISREPVSYRQWLLIKLWAQDRGYVFAGGGEAGNTGSVFPVINGMDLPVTDLNAESVLVFCNAYNEYLGKPPVYFYRPVENIINFMPFRNVEVAKDALSEDSENGCLMLPDDDEREAAEAVLVPSAYLGSEFVGGWEGYRAWSGPNWNSRGSTGFRLIMETE
ncbi:MAG: CsgG/HfaB family protein [Spirochaetia bacterium]|jgi:hypothetical protein|nr:CsgG/HfaB family protein [Spirochaetia bacterium]